MHSFCDAASTVAKRWDHCSASHTASDLKKYETNSGSRGSGFAPKKRIGDDAICNANAGRFFFRSQVFDNILHRSGQGKVYYISISDFVSFVGNSLDANALAPRLGSNQSRQSDAASICFTGYILKIQLSDS